MACTCIHANQHMRFPVFGPQPAGPAERWPVYFVPDLADAGFGNYYCPKCQDGLAQARAAACMEMPLDSVPTWWERVKTRIRGFFEMMENPRHLST